MPENWADESALPKNTATTGGGADWALPATSHAVTINTVTAAQWLVHRPRPREAANVGALVTRPKSRRRGSAALPIHVRADLPVRRNSRRALRDEPSRPKRAPASVFQKVAPVVLKSSEAVSNPAGATEPGSLSPRFHSGATGMSPFRSSQAQSADHNPRGHRLGRTSLWIPGRTSP